MKLTKNQLDFIALRAEGLSYEKISTQIGVSKLTIVRWNKKFISQIKEIQEAGLKEVQDSYKAKVRYRYDTLFQQLNKVDETILSNNLTKESLKDLIGAKKTLVELLDKLTEDKQESKEKDKPQEYNPFEEFLG